MKLIKAHITNFLCIHDSDEFDIDDVTCLVGKNQSGKTAILKALYSLNPIEAESSNIDDIRSLDYVHRPEIGERVVHAIYALNSEDIELVHKFTTCECLQGNKQTIGVKIGYNGNFLEASDLDIDISVILENIIKRSKVDVPSDIQDNVEMAHHLVESIFGEDPKLPEKYREILLSITTNTLPTIIFNNALKKQLPIFIYKANCPQMTGSINLNDLLNRQTQNGESESDKLILAALQSAGTSPEALINTRGSLNRRHKFDQTQSNLKDIADSILDFWTQHSNYNMKFYIQDADPGDPADMKNGLNLWILLEDKESGTEKQFSTESAGFIWFFSFLLQFRENIHDNKGVVLLLDEPGLSLHAKAQEDLVNYFRNIVSQNFQIIYTTHSPFMINRENNFQQVRIVENLSLNPRSGSLDYEELGTKVSSKIFEIGEGSLFPIQAALGYDVSQSLFINPNNLLVEGASDQIYIQIMSDLLIQRGEKGLNPRWSIIPVGGIDKVPTFILLIGANSDLNVAVLVDYRLKNQQKIENFYNADSPLDKSQVLTYADFVNNKEADIEDMFEADFYLSLVNEEFGISLTIADIGAEHPCILKRLKEYFENNPIPNNRKFSHLLPALYFSKNVSNLENQLSDLDFERFQKAFDALNALID